MPPKKPPAKPKATAKQKATAKPKATTAKPAKPKLGEVIGELRKLELYQDFEEFIELFISEYMDKKNQKYSDDARDFIIKKIISNYYSSEDNYKDLKFKYFRSRVIMIDWVEDLFEGTSQANKNFLKRIFGY